MNPDLKCEAGCVALDVNDKNELGNATVVKEGSAKDGVYPKGSVIETKCKEGYMFDTEAKRSRGTDKHECIGGREGWKNVHHPEDKTSRPGLCKPVCEITEKFPASLKPIRKYNDKCDVITHKSKSYLTMGNPFLYQLENGTQTNMMDCKLTALKALPNEMLATPSSAHKVLPLSPVDPSTLPPSNTTGNMYVVNPTYVMNKFSIDRPTPSIPGIYVNITSTGIVIPFTIVNKYKLPGVYIPIKSGITEIPVAVTTINGDLVIVLPVGTVILFEQLVPDNWVPYVLNLPSYKPASPQSPEYLFIPLLPPNLQLPNTQFIPITISNNIPVILIPLPSLPQPQNQPPTFTVPTSESPPKIVIEFKLGPIGPAPDVNSVGPFVPIFGAVGCKKIENEMFEVKMKDECLKDDMVNIGCKLTVNCKKGKDASPRPLKCTRNNGIAYYGSPDSKHLIPNNECDKPDQKPALGEDNGRCDLNKHKGLKIELHKKEGKCKKSSKKQPKGCRISVSCKKGEEPSDPEVKLPSDFTCDGTKFVNDEGKELDFKCKKKERKGCSEFEKEEGVKVDYSKESGSIVYANVTCQSGYYPSHRKYQEVGYQVTNCKNNEWENKTDNSTKDWIMKCSRGCINRPKIPLKESETAYKQRTFTSKKTGIKVKCRKEIAREAAAPIKYKIAELPYHCKVGETQAPEQTMQNIKEFPCTNACLDISDTTDIRSIDITSAKSRITWEGEKYVLNGHTFEYKCKNEGEKIEPDHKHSKMTLKCNGDKKHYEDPASPGVPFYTGPRKCSKP
ncbi:unnamed protein product [Bursaphelenchus okinawaensis]|uniref:Sushi domain-containing protein n=1 Tax=Bursaphelenchus okinawaensis TaxID=465554 RepID=A0A811KRZ4_9BILA|nr:unnamed protein product [Bursaphelenchus okinawaensis]CAG9110919.1 unnamed protein product [Bursaphelenchus okinawaensis]